MSAATQPSTATASRRLELPSTLAIGCARGAIEIKQFFRQRDAVVFTLAMPVVLMLMLGAIFDSPDPGDASPMSHVFAASIIAYGILSTAFVSIGIGVSADRDDGTLKRLRGMPISANSYFVGKVLLVAAVTLIEIVLLVGVAAIALDLPIPTDPSRWMTFAWLTCGSVTACTLLGIAASSVARSARSAPAVLTLPVVILQFASGIFVHASALPGWMLDAASIFPVRWMGQGFRSVFLPASMEASEPGQSWQHAEIAGVLGVWCVVGLVLCIFTFRWNDDGAQ